MTRAELLKRYALKRANCCKCGTPLTSSISLGYFFIMDYNGNFYCTECDQEFLDGDEKIFEPEEECYE